MIDLGTLGGDLSCGTAVSENGQVAGYSTINTTNGLIHAFLYQDGRMRDIGSLGDKESKTDQSFAMGVNSTGQVVGYAFLPQSQSHGIQQRQQVAFVYRDGAMQDLNKMIGGAARRYLIYAANAINDDGKIAATVFDNENGAFRAALLTPIEQVDLE